MAPHSSTLAWKIPWTEAPGRLQSMGSRRVRHDLTNFTFAFHSHALEKEMATHSSVLAWRIPGTEESGGLPSMGSHRVGHDWSDLAAAGTIDWFFIVLFWMTARYPFREYWIEKSPVFAEGVCWKQMPEPWGCHFPSGSNIRV